MNDAFWTLPMESVKLKRKLDVSNSTGPPKKRLKNANQKRTKTITKAPMELPVSTIFDKTQMKQLFYSLRDATEGQGYAAQRNKERCLDSIMELLKKTREAKKHKAILFQMVHYVKTHDRFAEGTAEQVREVLDLASHFPFTPPQKAQISKLGWKRSVDPNLSKSFRK